MKSLVGNIHFSSPNAAQSKKGQKSAQIWKDEKNLEIKMNNFLQEPENSAQSNPHFRSNNSNNSNNTNLSIDDPNNSGHKRNNSKTKQAKRPPKIDNYYQKAEFNKTETLKNHLKNSTLSNNSSSTTIKTGEQSRSHKKSLERSPKVEYKTFYESPGKQLNFSSHKVQTQ
mmetsp:Transcript_25252/g.22259  ORF Transcript_25252/g.22259 Transcript_25252/m.22259 type:complete len:170 (-) Transcript_25252:269-778(-)